MLSVGKWVLLGGFPGSSRIFRGSYSGSGDLQQGALGGPRGYGGREGGREGGEKGRGGGGKGEEGEGEEGELY